MCVEDQPEVLSALIKDIDIFSEVFHIVECDSGQDALDELEELDADGAPIALIISDCVMPGMSGVELLKTVVDDGRFATTRKLLLTGQASHQDTIDAINQAHIDSYIAKPWNRDQVIEKIKELVTHFIFDNGMDHTDFVGFTHSDVLFERLK